MKILMLCDHYPISPRVKKMRTSLKVLFPQAIIEVFVWNRENEKIKENYVFGYNQNLEYGNKFKKIANFIKFIFHAKKFQKKYSPTIVHAIDFEMLLCAVLITKRKIIYEVYDIKFLNNKYMNKIREKIEKKLINQYVKGIIFASPFFKKYYNNSFIPKVSAITINNKPYKLENEEYNKKNKISELEIIMPSGIVIGFIGTVRYENILNNLITAAKKNKNIIILIAGSGPALNSIKKRVLKEKLHEKVICIGRYEEKDLKSIYHYCDYIWAAYPSKDTNVKYAISNKFFESNIFKKPIIVSEKTYLGDFIKENNMGYTIDPYKVTLIDSFFKKIEKTATYNNEKSLGEGRYWQDEERRLLQIYD